MTPMWWWYIFSVFQAYDTTCVNCNRGLNILYSQSGGFWNMPTSYFAIKIILTQRFVILLFHVRSPVRSFHRLCFRKFCFGKGIFFRRWKENVMLVKAFLPFLPSPEPKEKILMFLLFFWYYIMKPKIFFFSAKEYWKVLEYLNIFTQRNHILESRIQLYF